VKAISKRDLTRDQFELDLMSSVRRLFGEFGLARIAPKLVRFDTSRSEAVLACNKEGAEDLQAAVGLISGTSETAVIALTVRTSGTIKGLKRRQRF
jgi:RNase P/RNase MRP subunit POP5